MGPVEVIVYGGGEYYRDVFQAVALMTGTNGLSSLIRLAMVIGLMMGILKAAFDFNIAQVFRWFMMAFLAYSILWVPKVQVQITDVFNPALTGGAVANVPLGVGMTASLASTVGHRVITLSEMAFSDPAPAQYSNTGMIYGAKVFERLRTARIADPRFDQNMQSLVRGCLYYDILTGHYTVGELARQNDIWNYVTVTRGMNPGRSVEYVNPSGAREIVSCTVAAQRMNTEWTATIQGSMRLFQRRARPDMAESQLQSAFQAEMGALHPMMLGASRDATSAFQQVLMINSMRRGVTGFSAEAGGGAMGVMAETQAEVQTRNTQMLLGGVAEKAIVILKIVVDLLFIGMFPVLFPAFLLPKLGPKMIQGYLTGFLYLQLWGPMYVILNKIVTGWSVTRTGAASYIPDTSPGFKIANLEAIGSVNADIAAVAGVMTMMIPVMAGLLTRGAMAVGAQGEALLSQFRSGAEAAGGAATTGNYSFGNTAFDNQSWANRSANRWVTSGEYDVGNFRQTDQGLNRIEQGANGAMVMTAPMSSGFMSMRHSEGISAAHTEQAGMRREEAQALQMSITQADSRMRTEGVEAVQSWLQGTTSTRTTGSDGRETHGALYTELDSVSQSLQRQHGWTDTEARQRTARAAMEVFGEASLSTPGAGVLPASARAGVRGSAGGEVSWSGSAAETDSLNMARQALSSSQFADRVDQTTARYAMESFSTTNTAQSMSSERVADTFSSTRTIQDAVNQSESQARYHDERADYSRTNAATMDANYNNVFTDYAIDKLVGTRDSYGAIIDQDRARQMLAGRTAEDVSRVEEVARDFHQDMAARIETPTQVLEGRNIGADIREYEREEFRVPAPSGDRSDLRENLSTSWATGGQSEGTGSGGQAPRTPDRGAGESPAPASPPSTPWSAPGEPVLRPGFNSEVREGIRADTARAGALLESERAADGRLWRGPSEEHVQQNTGQARLDRRHGRQ